MEVFVLWDMTPCSLVKFYQSFRGKYCLYLKSRYSGRSPETPVNIYRTPKRHIPENKIYTHRNKNLSFHNFNLDLRSKNYFEICYFFFEASAGLRDTSFGAHFIKMDDTFVPIQMKQLHGFDWGDFQGISIRTAFADCLCWFCEDTNLTYLSTLRVRLW
jgi:hypothetical protein